MANTPLRMSSIADLYDQLVREKNARRHKRWSPAKRAVWTVVTARCQKDMGGIESMLTDSSITLADLAAALTAIGEKKLAAACTSAMKGLQKRGYLDENVWSGKDADATCERIFDKLDRALDDHLWDLDEKLSRLL